MNIPELKKFCEHPDIELICHNAQHEHKWFLARGIDANIKYDTRLELRLFDERLPADLGSSSMRFGIDRYYKDIDPRLLTGKGLQERPTKDAANTLALHDIIYPQLSSVEKEVYHRVLVPATKTLAQIELEGVCVDPKKFDQLTKDLTKRIAGLKLDSNPDILEYLKAHPKTKVFNVNSSPQKSALVFDMLGYEPLSWTKPPACNPKIDEENLEAIIRLQHYKGGHKDEEVECKLCHDTTLYKLSCASKWLGWRDKSLKQLKEHIAEIGGKHYIFTNLMVAEAATGRLISTGPNLQNIARGEIRAIFIPRYKWLTEFDYKGIELRIWACLCHDAKLIEAFLSGDPHVDTASDIFAKKIKTVSDAERYIGKTFNYIIVNGGGANRLALLTGVPEEDADKMFKRFWKAHPNGRDFWEEWVEVEEYDNWGRPKSGIVYSPTGMKRHFEKPTQARNQLIQNPALIVILQAANEVVPYMKAHGDGVIPLTVHDSLLVDSNGDKKVMRDIKDIMEAQKLNWYDGKGKEHTIELPFLVEAKRGKNWASMKEIEI